jgi:hypothetical protein
MICEHLTPLANDLVAAGVRETYRGQAWTHNCREWVYFDCCLDRKSIRTRLGLSDIVQDHEHIGTHDGRESGFYCLQCRDAIMGVHKLDAAGKFVMT